ncbi:MAG: AMP-binding protein, partial [Candidatus Hydrogenedentes bacterium]|nr:AMP-binding protein [Candidatus Hydrogenedentota bacterium]
MTITQLLEDQAAKYEDKTLLISDGEELSYRAVQQRAASVAAGLADHGVGAGDKIILLMGNCLEFLYVFLGAGRIGAVVVPVNPLLKPDEIAFIANDSDAETLIMIPEFAALLPQVAAALPKVKRVFVLGDAPAGAPAGSVAVLPFACLLECAETPPAIAAGSDDDAALIYTSGTTGLPKGVILTHRNYLANARMILRTTTMSGADRFLLVLPLFHVNAQVVSILAPMIAGADVYVMKKFNPFAILPLIEKFRATILSAVPTIYNVMCRMPKAAEYDIDSIRFFVSGAAPMPEETYRDVQRVLRKPLIMGYGLSEATCASAAADYRDPIKWNSVGSPLRYTCIRIVDENGVDVAVGDTGEIVVSGPAVMKGYYKNPEATK